tara:strand:- start:402 stop:845 length:444 start_codon:yes stop_codon:yes gene_type:complete
MEINLEKYQELADFVKLTLEVKDELHAAELEIERCNLEDARQQIEQLRIDNEALTRRKKFFSVPVTDKFEIKKGIPLPRSKGKPRKYDLPLEDLEVDDNIHIPIPKTKITQEQKIIRNFVLRFTYKNPNKKFTVRQLADGIGIWRIK